MSYLTIFDWESLNTEREDKNYFEFYRKFELPDFCKCIRPFLANIVLRYTKKTKKIITQNRRNCMMLSELLRRKRQTVEIDNSLYFYKYSLLSIQIQMKYLTICHSKCDFINYEIPKQHLSYFLAGFVYFQANSPSSLLFPSVSVLTKQMTPQELRL